MKKRKTMQQQKRLAIMRLVFLMILFYLFMCGLDRAFYIASTSRGHEDTMQAWNIYNIIE